MSQTEASTYALVSCDWLAQHLNDPGVRLVEDAAEPPAPPPAICLGCPTVFY